MNARRMFIRLSYIIVEDGFLFQYKFLRNVDSR